jgi:hypothetical protein
MFKFQLFKSKDQQETEMPAEEPTIETLQAELKAAKAELALASRNGDDLKKSREEHEAAVKALSEANDKIKATKEEGDKKVTEEQKNAKDRLVKAELKVVATTAGARNFSDVLALVDMAKVKLDANGELENGDELIAALKKDKPYLFARAQSTHTESDVPPQPKVGVGQKTVKEMTKEEYREAKKANGLR